MPSDSETLGFVVLEAKASGIPVVGVAAGGLIDVIDSGSAGFLVPNDENMVEFSAKVKELIENPKLRQQMGTNAHKWTQQWSWESATSDLRNVQYPKAISIFAARHNKNKNQE
jgi:sulfoquinovosyltransferase